MRFGVILPNYGPQASPQALLATAWESERLGFHSLWATDHLLLPPQDAARFGVLFEALTTLAFLAGATSRLRLGVSSLVLPQRQLVVVAKQVAALDALSGGRALLCVSVGWSAGEYRNLGASFEDRGRRLDEAIQVLRALWAARGTEPVRFQGRYYAFEGVFAPPPAQPGGPPIWVGGNSPPALRRAARLGDGWHPTGLDPQAFRQGADRFRALRGDRPATLSLRLRLDPTGQDPRATLRGASEAVIATLQAYAEAGLEVAVVTFPGETPQARLEAMARFAEEVMPAFAEP